MRKVDVNGWAGWMDPLNRSEGWAAVSGLVLLVLALGRYWPPSDFPFVYHNDEPSKVEQIQTGQRNLRHPVLMLAVTDGVVGVWGVRRDGQAVARLGRGLSGLAVAVAVAGLGFAVALAVGWLPGVMAGLLALQRPWFFEAAQMFKEDAWHLGTIGLVAAAAALWAARGHGVRRRVVWALGFGCVLGLAISARYYAVLPAGLLLMWVWQRGGRWWQGTAWAMLGMLVVFLVLHGPWLGQVSEARGEIAREVDYLARGHFGVGEAVPHRLYWRRWEEMASAGGWLLVGLGLVWALWRRWWGLLLAAVAVWFYVWLISHSPKFSDRYFLPVEWFWCAGLGLGLGAAGRLGCRLGRAYGDRVGWWGSVVCVAGLGFWQMAEWQPELSVRQERFQRDDRRELAIWMERHLPPEARWVEDDQAQIRLWLPGRVVGWSEFVVDLGTAEEWMMMGADYAILCRDRHHRYTARGQVARRDESGLVAQRRERYRRLLEEGEVLWSSPGRDPKVLHPGLELIWLGPMVRGREERWAKVEDGGGGSDIR